MVALAHQHARVIAETAEIHQLASEDSPPVGQLNRSQTVEISSKWVTDTLGHNWYKILNPRGGFGYIEANQLETETVKRELASVQIRPSSDKMVVIPPEVHTWHFVLRGMVTGIFTPFVSTSSLISSGKSTSSGGELEFTYSLPFEEDGDMAHLIALGLYAYSWGPNNPTVLGGVLIYRPSLSLTVQPEFRLRAADFSASTGPLYSAALAFQAPFSPHSPFLAAYFEAGLFASQGFTVDLPFISLGLGLHI